MPEAEDFHHSVYVILLDPAVIGHPSIQRLNPNRDPSKPCVYVGMTGLPVDHRFENHKAGYKSAWVVEKYGVRLMPELYEHLNPMPFEAAVQMETDLADELRTAEYTVKSEPVSSQKLDHAPETRVGIVIMTTGLTASGIINPGADPVMPT